MDPWIPLSVSVGFIYLLECLSLRFGPDNDASWDLVWYCSFSLLAVDVPSYTAHTLHFCWLEPQISIKSNESRHPSGSTDWRKDGVQWRGGMLCGVYPEPSSDSRELLHAGCHLFLKGYEAHMRPDDFEPGNSMTLKLSASIAWVRCATEQNPFGEALKSAYQSLSWDAWLPGPRICAWSGCSKGDFDYCILDPLDFGFSVSRCQGLEIKLAALPAVPVSCQISTPQHPPRRVMKHPHCAHCRPWDSIKLFKVRQPYRLQWVWLRQLLWFWTDTVCLCMCIHKISLSTIYMRVHYKWYDKIALLVVVWSKFLALSLPRNPSSQPVAIEDELLVRIIALHLFLRQAQERSRSHHILTVRDSYKWIWARYDVSLHWLAEESWRLRTCSFFSQRKAEWERGRKRVSVWHFIPYRCLTT